MSKVRWSLVFAILGAFLVYGPSVLACPWCEKGREKYLSTRATLIEGLGSHHHPVSTTIEEAQCFFNQGLMYCFAFNHDEAIRSFKRAAELDPELAMAHWGIAYALGTNYNLPIDSVRMLKAYDATQKALALAGKATRQERAYIEALATRYSLDFEATPGSLDSAYKQAMEKVYRDNPDDLDAAVFYAEAAMNLRPWMLWNRDGTPSPGTEELVGVLESVLLRRPDHAGACHFYIHAVEASKHPEKALICAQRLLDLVPASGHLVHMPAHTYIRVGDYAASVEANRRAIAVDSAYIAANGGQGFYSLLYVPHNIHFYSVSCSMAGQYAEALRSAEKLEAYIASYVKLDPMVEGVAPTKYMILTKFRKWDEILNLPKPDQELKVVTAVWHFARGMALASQGNPQEARKELKRMEAAQKEFSPKALMGAINTAPAVMKVAGNVLLARIAEAENKPGKAVEHYKAAVADQDNLAYDEPEGWYLSTRESLGGLYLKLGQFTDAERVFREDLEHYPRNGRALFGLKEALAGMENKVASTQVEQQYLAAWKTADTKISLQDL